MKTLILDIARWRCGKNSYFSLGRGCTSLLNYSGYMCCLGQFAEQLGVPPIAMLDEPSFDGINAKPIKGLSYKRNGCICNTKLSRKAMEINDNELTTPKQKVKQLKELFAKYGYKIKLKNAHLLK